MIDWQKSPLSLELDTLKYPEGLVPFPTLSFCPDQILDELHPVAIAMDQVIFISVQISYKALHFFLFQIKLHCLVDNVTSLLLGSTWERCDDNPTFKAIRDNPGSVAYHLLRALNYLYTVKLELSLGENDWIHGYAICLCQAGVVFSFFA